MAVSWGSYSANSPSKSNVGPLKRVQTASGESAAALEFLHELEIHAKVGFNQIVFAETLDSWGALDYLVRRPMSKNFSPAAEESRKSSAQSSTIQSAPACWSSASLAVVRNARTRAPAALPARIPAGASSITRQSAAGTPRICAPF